MGVLFYRSYIFIETVFIGTVDEVEVLACGGVGTGGVECV